MKHRQEEVVVIKCKHPIDGGDLWLITDILWAVITDNTP